MAIRDFFSGIYGKLRVYGPHACAYVGLLCMVAHTYMRAGIQCIRRLKPAGPREKPEQNTEPEPEVNYLQLVETSEQGSDIGHWIYQWVL